MVNLSNFFLMLFSVTRSEEECTKDCGDSKTSSDKPSDANNGALNEAHPQSSEEASHSDTQEDIPSTQVLQQL